MLKRSLFFSNPYYLSVKNKQLVISCRTTGETKQTPIEDLGFVILENPQITITIKVAQELADNNVAVVFCDSKHHPSSMLLNLDGHHLQSEMFSNQIKASEPLKKQLWKQTIVAKINNQAAVLKSLGKNYLKLTELAKNVASGDSTNREAQASRIYWNQLFGNEFTRDRIGIPPNNALNYGYSILRAAVARALVGSGLLPTLGIHHHNKYNAFCLADDIMEPYRPYVDLLVVKRNTLKNFEFELTTNDKAEFMQLLTTDVVFEKTKRPLMVGLSQTTASLAKCFSGNQKTLEYPEI
ncbi:MAG: type II CRISPR-associated endonuclease Cas1 [Bacteroidota bacterium]